MTRWNHFGIDRFSSGISRCKLRYHFRVSFHFHDKNVKMGVDFLFELDQCKLILFSFSRIAEPLLWRQSAQIHEMPIFSWHALRWVPETWAHAMWYVFLWSPQYLITLATFPGLTQSGCSQTAMVKKKLLAENDHRESWPTLVFHEWWCRTATNNNKGVRIALWGDFNF